MIIRTAHARWEGDLKSGTGTLQLGSGAIKSSYSFDTRFESAAGTNPEELLGAAHAACFSMALNAKLYAAGHAANGVETTAEVQMIRVDGAMTITGITLTTVGSVAGISAERFQELAEDAAATCIISRALAAIPLTLHASLH